MLVLTGSLIEAQSPQEPHDAKKGSAQAPKVGASQSQPTAEQLGADGHQFVVRGRNSEVGTTPLAVKSMPAEESKDEAAHKEFEYQEKPQLDRWLTWSTVFLAACTFFLFVFTGALWWVTYRLSRDAKAAGETQDFNMLESLRIASEAARASSKQAQSIVAAERAYVKLSHSAPGLKSTPGFTEVTLEIKNWGKTPADVTDVQIGFKYLEFGDALPVPYPFETAARESFPSAFLVSGESFFITKFAGPGLTAQSGKKQLWIFGHVDYVDVFEKRWRGGYARKFVDQRDNNLVYNTEGRDNFDRPRVRGEGGDWD